MKDQHNAYFQVKPYGVNCYTCKKTYNSIVAFEKDNPIHKQTRIYHPVIIPKTDGVKQ